MHLSHISEDLEAWYLNFDSDERVDTAFRPRPRGAAGRRRPCRRAPSDVADVARRAPRLRPLRRDRPQRVDPDGLAPAAATSSAPDGTVYPKGTAIPQRADFNTLDNPFFWSATRSATAWARGRRRASTSSSSTRRATTSTATGSRWMAYA